MMRRCTPTSRAVTGRPAAAFTLVELLVVMGVIALLSTLTVLGYRGIARDARLASGKNAVMAALDNARLLAIKRNQIVAVVFRPRLEGTREQYLEAVIVRWTGESGIGMTAFGNDPPEVQIIDRFVPVEGSLARRLPVGVKVAGPAYGESLDQLWNTPPHFPAINQTSGNGEAPGRLLGIMYAPDGRVITRNSIRDSARAWVDFDGKRNNNGQPLQMIGPAPGVNYYGSVAPTVPPSAYLEYRMEKEEPFIDFAPFLAVFDDDLVRELYNVSQWRTSVNANAFVTRRNDYTDYLTKNADVIHFNRYTGVVMR